jgi:hypothetical protein
LPFFSHADSTRTPDPFVDSKREVLLTKPLTASVQFCAPV